MPNRVQSILIVDDNKIFLELLVVVFQMYGLKVYKADNGFKAWELFKNETIDIVLTDIQMPGLDGAELSCWIRDQSPHKKIAVMTGGDADVALQLLNKGIANYFFSKPFSLRFVCKSLLAEAQVA